MNYKDVFISYGRAESKHFAGRLHDVLAEKGFNVWFDQNDIPLAVDFQDQIDEGIEKADNFVFIIAPHALRSPYCLKEIELATKHSKRIIPILHIEPKDKEVWDLMHDSISKRNWIYMRQMFEANKEQNLWDNIDDIDTAYQDLIDILSSHKEYVRSHTRLLNTAIQWEKHYRNTRYLPFGDRQGEAEKWLLTKFEEEQPPCLPSALHCEFIAEAKKNAENRMTDAFISYAEDDEEIRNLVLRSLSQHLVTTWTHQLDIQTGADFDKEVERGIERADNFIFFITHESVKSDYCLRELTHANKYNKRIIPLYMEDVPQHDFPIEIRNLQYIDFTDNDYDFIPRSKNEKTDYERDIDDLLYEIHDDRDYYHKHKIILDKAIRWKEQNHNASILLRGHNLDEAKVWLKIGLQRDSHPPTRLHEEFVRESEAKSGQLSTEVFISYSRADSDFARKLNDELQENGKTTWFDQESIASGADFQQEIYNGIESCDNFLFIISPESVSSPYCEDEVRLATKLEKRIITVLYTHTEVFEIPIELSKVQWINFVPNEVVFHDAFAELIRTLDTDRTHVQAHNRWFQEASEWNKNNRSDDFLLVGAEYLLAKSWYDEALDKNKIPPPNELQRDYLEASQAFIELQKEKKKEVESQLLKLEKERNAEARKRIERQKILLIIASIALIISICTGVYAFYKKNEAEEATRKAVLAEQEIIDAKEKLESALNELKTALDEAKLATSKAEQAQLEAETALEEAGVANRSRVQAEARLASSRENFNDSDFVKDQVFLKDKIRVRKEILTVQKDLINYVNQLSNLGVVKPRVHQSLKNEVNKEINDLLKRL